MKTRTAIDVSPPLTNHEKESDYITRESNPDCCAFISGVHPLELFDVDKNEDK
jgi:hypothetical protein